MTYTIALPTGKSMETQTLALFGEAGINVHRSNPRSIVGRVSGLTGLDRAIFCRPSEIPRLVAAGAAELGVTGHDVLVQSGYTERVATLGAHIAFSRNSLGDTRCIFFARADDPVRRIDDLSELGVGVTIATEYLRETERYLKKRFGRERQFDLQAWSGSAEVAVATGLARFGVALVETGNTLAVNGLREIEDSVIHRSMPVVIVQSELTKFTSLIESEKVLRPLEALLTGVTKARSSVVLVMNVPRNKLDELLSFLPASESPTITPLAEEDFVSCTSVVPERDANDIIARALQVGAKDIMKQRLSVIV